MWIVNEAFKGYKLKGIFLILWHFHLQLNSLCLHWTPLDLLLRLDQHWSWHPFTPQLDLVSHFRSRDYGNWYLILNHTVLIRHPNGNISLCSADRSKVESLRSHILSFWTLPRSHYQPCQHIYVSCNHNNKLSRSQWKSGSAICQNCLIQPLNKTPYWQ